jgi:hypothetical protein
VFTCPVCVGITVASWDSWPEHWKTYHVPGQAMAMVLNEMAVNVRFGWGLALIAAITMCNILGAKLDEGEEPDMRTNPWGGYCPRTYRAKTMQARVKEARDKILPEALRSAAQPVQQPPQRQELPKATNFYRRASIGSASFTSTRPGTPQIREQGGERLSRMIRCSAPLGHPEPQPTTCQPTSRRRGTWRRRGTSR